MDNPPDLWDLLIDLNHLDDGTRAAAFNTLVGLGQEVVPALVEDFDRISGAARLSVIRAFGAIRDPRAVPLLLDLVQSDDPNEYLFASSLAAKALGQIGDPTASEGLVSLLTHDRSGPRRMAVVVLGNIGDHKAVTGLIGALRDTDPQTRVFAARSLEQIGTPQAIAAVAAWRDRVD
jgi:HEAT repeat protein